MQKDSNRYRSPARNLASRSRVAKALLALLLIVLGGSAGFMVIEGWDLWRSLFFTLITITTVGYGAEGLSQAGERFTTLLLIGGIGSAAYAFGAIVEAAVGHHLDWRRRMQQQIDRLRNHYIICGYGRIGCAICEQLDAASFPFVVIEGDAEAFQQACDQGRLAIRGCATQDEILQQAGLERARGLVCAVDSDSDNIVITLGAREMRSDLTIIARVDHEGAARRILQAGATQVISPFRTGAMDIATAIIRPHLSKFLHHSDHAKGGYRLGEVTIEGNSPLVGRTIRDLGREEGRDIVFVAIAHRDGTTRVHPGGDTVFESGDVLIIASDQAGISRMSMQVRGRMVA